VWFLQKIWHGIKQNDVHLLRPLIALPDKSSLDFVDLLSAGQV